MNRTYFTWGFLFILFLSAIILPNFGVLECGHGHSWGIHITYGILLVLSIPIELNYCRRIYRHFDKEFNFKKNPNRDYFTYNLEILGKELPIQHFTANLIGSMISRFDLYSDFISFNVMYSCGCTKLWKASLAFLIIPLTIELLFILFYVCDRKND